MVYEKWPRHRPHLFFLGGLIHSPNISIHLRRWRKTRINWKHKHKHLAVNRASTSFHIPDLIQISCSVYIFKWASLNYIKPSWQVLYTQHLNILGKYQGISSPSILSNMSFSVKMQRMHQMPATRSGGFIPKALCSYTCCPGHLCANQKRFHPDSSISAFCVFA